MLTVSDLRFSYPARDTGGDPVVVLSGANLQLRAGLAIGLLGPNGSGKSTMLGAITNSISGDQTGTIGIGDEAVGPIGFATQNPALYHHLSVRENLEHAARLATGRWRVGNLVETAVDEYQLAPILPVTARHLSGGQTRIAHLACSFIHQPTIRLLDEPTTALDFETRQLLVELVHGWRRDGKAILVTAHYPEDIEELCSELVVLVDGRTRALGSIQDHLASLGTTASVTTASAQRDLAVSPPTLNALAHAARSAGLASDEPVRELRMSPPTLREVLRRDPTLRSAVADAESGASADGHLELATAIDLDERPDRSDGALT